MLGDLFPIVFLFTSMLISPLFVTLLVNHLYILVLLVKKGYVCHFGFDANKTFCYIYNVYIVLFHKCVIWTCFRICVL